MAQPRRLSRIEDQMDALIPNSIDGAVAQLRLFRFYQSIDFEGDQLIDNLLAGLEQLGETGAR
jgi:hypothetical protein